MKSFFNAKSIAVIGASRNPDKVGGVIFRNLIGNTRLRVFPVNSSANEIGGIKAYPDVLSIPFVVDLSVIAVKAEDVPEVLEQCGKKNIKSVIIISSGFSEAGRFDLEDEIKEIAERYDIKIIGPNVLGILNTYKGINASFFKEMPEKGKVALISQSGAVGTSILDRALKEKLGFSGFVSLGNMTSIDFIDALEYFGDDLYTEVIIIYLESLNPLTGKRFIELCKEISKKKKIIAIKAGKSKKGNEAAKTHTASMSSSSKIYSGAFKQAGIIEVETIEEMFVLSKIYSKFKRFGNKGVIVTNAGGLGVLSVDSCVESGIELPEIPELVLKEIDEFLPEGYSKNNPLDILGDAPADRYGQVLKILSKYNFFDFFIVIMSPQKMTQALETAQVLPEIRKPVFAFLIGGDSFNSAKKFLCEKGMVVFDDVSKIRFLKGFF
ncbi:MAG: CoA-binding protein [Nanoarchaeota archaeon]